MQALENKFEAELVERASRIIGKVAKEEAERTAKRIPYNIMKFNAAKGGCCSKGKDHQHKYDDDECSSSSSYSDESGISVQSVWHFKHKQLAVSHVKWVVAHTSCVELLEMMSNFSA